MPRAQELEELHLARQPPIPEVRRDGGIGSFDFMPALGVALRRRELRVDGGRALLAKGPGTRHRRRRSHIVRASKPLHDVRVLGREHLPFRALEALVPWRQIQHDRLRPRVEHQVRAGGFDARQVVHRVTLPWHAETARERRALHDGHGVTGHGSHHAPAARAQFVGREVGLVNLCMGERCNGERKQGQARDAAALHLIDSGGQRPRARRASAHRRLRTEHWPPALASSRAARRRPFQ